MSAAAAAILEGMPDPRDLHRLDTGGETVIFAGTAELFRFAEDDAAGRHLAAAVLRQLKFPGRDVAAVLGLSPAYVATLHQRALREGTAALVRPAGRPRETGRGGVGPGAGVAGRRGAGRGDRAAAGGEPVHRAAAAGPGARAGPAAAGGPGTGRRGRAGGGRGAGTVWPARPRGPGVPGAGGACGRRACGAGERAVPVRRGDAAARVRGAGRSGGDLPGRGRGGRGAG